MSVNAEWHGMEGSKAVQLVSMLQPQVHDAFEYELKGGMRMVVTSDIAEQHMDSYRPMYITRSNSSSGIARV